MLSSRAPRQRAPGRRQQVRAAAARRCVMTWRSRGRRWPRSGACSSSARNSGGTSTSWVTPWRASAGISSAGSRAAVARQDRQRDAVHQGAEYLPERVHEVDAGAQAEHVVGAEAVFAPHPVAAVDGATVQADGALGLAGGARGVEQAGRAVRRGAGRNRLDGMPGRVTARRARRVSPRLPSGPPPSPAP